MDKILRTMAKKRKTKRMPIEDMPPGVPER